MNLKETLPPLRGTLSIFRTDTGASLLVRENIIVQQTIYGILDGFANAVTTSPVTSLQIGTGGTSDPTGLFPIQPSYTQTALNTYLATLMTTPSNLSTTNNYVTFTGTISQSQFNGYGISEAALFTASGLMFNYLTFPAIQKTSQFGISFSWNVGF